MEAAPGSCSAAFSLTFPLLRLVDLLSSCFSLCSLVRLALLSLLGLTFPAALPVEDSSRPGPSCPCSVPELWSPLGWIWGTYHLRTWSQGPSAHWYLWTWGTEGVAWTLPHGPVLGPL